MNEKTRILIVDDDPHLLQGMSRILKSAGYETIEAANGTDCLRFTIEQKPDLVLLDVMLPDINGIEVCKRIKLDKTLADCYVVLLSSLRIGSDDQAEGLETGADGYIARPVSNRELLARVESLLRLKRAEEAIRKSEERFRRISSMTSDISYSCTKSNNAAYSIDWIMGAVEQITGHSADDVIALGCWRNLVFDEDLPIFDSKVLCLAPGTSASCELRLAHNTGKVVWVASLAECVLDSGSPDSLRLYGALVDITERKQSEEVLRQSEEKFSKAFFLSPDAISVSRLVDGKFVSVNEGFKQIFGYAEAEVIGKTSLELHIWDKPEHRNRWTEKLKSEGIVDNFETRFRTNDGDIRYGLMSASIIELNGVEHILNVTRDITERKLAQEQLKQSEEKYRLLADNMEDVIWQLTPDLMFTYISPSIRKQRGYDPSEILGRPIWEFITPDSIEPIKARVAERLELLRSDREGFIPEPYVTEQIRKDGTTVWTETITNPVFNNEGQLIAFQGVTRDITKSKRTEEALRESEEIFKYFMEYSPISVFFKDENLRSLRLSKNFETMLGKPVVELLGKSDDELFSSEFAKSTVAEDMRVMKEGKGITIEEELNGRFYSTTKFPILIDGNPRYLAGYTIDITERKLAEEALRQSEEKFSKAFHLNPDAITITRFVDGIIVSANEGVQEILGFAEDELIGKSALEINIWDNPEDRNRWIEKLKAEGKVANFEARFRTKDGGIRYGLISASIVEFNRAPHILTVARDITERVQAEEEKESLRSQLLQAQKMEAVGNLAGGVAHDFNNLLQVALGYSEILLVGKNPDHPDYDKLHTINATAKRGADLVQRLMVFSRKGDTKPRSLNLNHEVTQLKKLLERTIPKMIAIELSLESWLPVINADPVQVEQILLNLAVNARDAMPQEGGKLTIETRKVMLDEEYCRMHLEAKQGQYVMISVSDTGHGMSQETVQHIFEPFFTTKGEGKGTGLGLAMVYGIMKHHEGFINCYSEPGHGTTFRIYFPVVQTEVEEDLERESAIPQGGSETILLVDDEESLCDIGSQLLTRAGYTVLTATNGRDAIDLYRNQRGDISLVILDLIMPEMGGKECFQELAKIDSKVKVILSSGFLSDRTSEEARVFGFRGLVEKPYNMRQLLGMVRDVLDGD
jgi:PAS domain S-box-containing protein